MIGLVFTLLWFPLVGLAVSRLVGRVNVFLAGAGVHGLVLFIAGALHLSLVATAIAMGIVALAVIACRSAVAKPPLSYQGGSFAAALLYVAIMALLFVSAVMPLADYDGRAFWLLKAKAIAHERSIDGPLFHGATMSPRNEYPLLVPLDAATVMFLARELDERHVRWLYALFAIALALEVRRRIGPWYAVLVLWLPQILLHPEGSALSAYSDVALAAFVACAMFELVSESPDPLRFGLWVAFASVTKNEGLPFALVLLAIGVFVFRARAAIAAIPAGIGIATLLLWRSRIEPSDEAIFHLSTLPGRLSELEDAILGIVRHLVAFRDWGLLWIAVAAALAVLAWHRRWRPLLICLAAILPMLALYVIMYLISNWPVEDLVNASAPRLLTHFIGPALLLIHFACESLERSKTPATP